jgi:hypothetical protein
VATSLFHPTFSPPPLDSFICTVHSGEASYKGRREHILEMIPLFCPISSASLFTRYISTVCVYHIEKYDRSMLKNHIEQHGVIFLLILPRSDFLLSIIL